MSAKTTLKTIQRGIAVNVRALGLVWRASPGSATLNLVATLFSALMIPAQVWISREAIDRVSTAINLKADLSSNWTVLVTPMLLYLIVWGLGEFFQAISFGVNELIQRKVHYYAHQVVLKKAASLSLAFYETPAYFDQMQLARSEIWRYFNIAYFTFSILTQAITVTALLIMLGQVGVALPVVLVFTTLPRLISQSYFMTERAKLIMRNAPAERMADYLSWLLTAREPVKEVRLFKLQNYILQKFRKYADQYVNSIGSVVIPQARTNFFLSLISLMGTIAIWGYAILEAMRGNITIGAMALIFQATERCRTTLDPLFSDFGYIFENVFYLNNFFGFLDLVPGSVTGALSHPATGQGQPPEVGALETGTLTFNHVTFHYPGADSPALQDLSFTIRPGETIALVGENGAGKTTLVKLLSRLYDPSQGQILLNGRDLRDYDLESYYTQVGVIFQDFTRYDLSARENIGFGSIEEVDNLERVQLAAEMGGARGLIEKLPYKFETMLGKRFENGDAAKKSVDLSGGEWQKIALARAFMRTINGGKAAMLILDEPTAALDAFAESEVYNHFSELTQGKTTIFVTHRLSSVKIAQKILVLKGGRLIEAGNHAELMAMKGEYARMFLLQAERYQIDATEEPA